MAYATNHQKSKKNQGSDDFSVIAGNTDSILRNTSWPRQDDPSFATRESARIPSQSEEFYDSGQISASHYALATAYERVSQKLAEAEKRNQQLMQDSLRTQFRSAKMSGSVGSQVSYALPPHLEDSVNQAWEAYNEKCKECQQLREELEEVKSRDKNSEHHSRIQNLEEDVLREKAKQDDVVRKLEKTKMEADHLEKKEILAREELEKEREYQRNLISSAERKHKEMEQRIEGLERSLSMQKNVTEDLRRREKDRAKALEDQFISKREVFHDKIRELEEQNISLKEEVAVLLSMQTASSARNGPCSRPLVNGPSNAHEPHNLPPAFENEIGTDSFEHDIQLIFAEMNELRTRANEQSMILSSLCQNPKITTLLESIHQMPAAKSESFGNQQPSMKKSGTDQSLQDGMETAYVRKKTQSPKMSKNIANQNEDCENLRPSSPNIMYEPSVDTLPHQKPLAVRPGEMVGSSLKSTEEFIRSLPQDVHIQNRRMIRPGQRPDNAQPNTVFPAMDVSRVIHTPESGVSQASQTRIQGSENSAGDFNPAPNSQKQMLTGGATMAVAFQHQFHNGGVTMPGKMPVNGQQNLYSLPVTMDHESQQFYSAQSHNSLSSTDTLVVSPGIVPPSGTIFSDATGNNGTPATFSDRTPLLDASSSRQIRESDHVETPANRHPRLSSDEDNNSDDGFEQLSQISDDFCPKEFVVPKVVRAPDLTTSTAQNRKAFQDTGYVPASAQANARPAIRAKSDASTTSPQSNNRTTRAAIPHQYPESRPSKKSPQERTCPICPQVFTVEWTEAKMNRHINGHFSDDEDRNLLSFD